MGHKKEPSTFVGKNVTKKHAKCGLSCSVGETAQAGLLRLLRKVDTLYEQIFERMNKP